MLKKGGVVARRLAPSLVVSAAGFLVGTLAGLGSARAADDGGALRLTWTAPSATCPSGEDVRSATLRNAKVATVQPGDALEADARVDQLKDTSWRVRLRTRRGGNVGEREIVAASCSGVADATAVVLALALVPPGSAIEAPVTQQVTVAGPAPAAAAAPPTTTTAATTATETDRPRAPASSSASSSHALAFGASGAADLSTLPSTAAGGSLTLAWTPGRLRFEADARRWGSQSAAVADSSAGARFSMTTLGGRACFAALRTGRSPGAQASGSNGLFFEASPCVGGDVHLVAADGYGADTNYSASAQWTTIDGGALLRLGFTSWLALRSRIDAFTPLTRPTFVVENTGMVYRPPTLGASASFGVEVLFL